MKTSMMADAVRKRLKLPNPLIGIHIDSAHPQQRQIPVSHASHIRGWHPVRPGHQAVQFESKLESKVISALARFPQLEAVQSQPVTVMYWQDGRIRQYTPDFLVVLSSVPKPLALLGFGLRTYVEVKPLLRACALEEPLSVKFEVIREAMRAPITLLTDFDVTCLHQEVCHVA